METPVIALPFFTLISFVGLAMVSLQNLRREQRASGETPK